MRPEKGYASVGVRLYVYVETGNKASTGSSLGIDYGCCLEGSRDKGSVFPWVVVIK